MPHKGLVSLSKRHHDNQDYSVAEFGHTDAQNNLGVCYENGHGVPRIYMEAVKWYKKAAEQGNKNAIKALKRLGEK